MQKIDDIDIFAFQKGGSATDKRESRLPELTPAQTANILGAFADPLGLIDISGEFPEFPAPGVSMSEMVIQGPRSPSLIENLREGNFGAAALQSMGAIPVIGGAARTARGMIKAADRLAKAEKAGFDTGTVYYHATDKLESGGDFTQLKPSERGKLGPGIYMSPDPKYTERYIRTTYQTGNPDSPLFGDNARILPVFVRGKIGDISDFDGFLEDAKKSFADLPPGSLSTKGQLLKKMAQDEMAEAGFAGFQVGEELVIFDPKNVRSVNAAFEDLDSPELLKASGGSVNQVDIFDVPKMRFGGAARALTKTKKAPKDSYPIAEQLARQGIPAKEAATFAAAAMLIASPEDSEAAVLDLALKLFREKNLEPLELKPTFVRGERRTAKRVSLTEQEIDVLEQSVNDFNLKPKKAGDDTSVTLSEAVAAYKDWKRRHPPADWVQPELSGFSINNKGNIKFEFKSPMYAYNKSKTTGKPIALNSAEYNKIRRNVSNEIIDYLERALTDPDDAAAQTVLSNAGWYKNVERRLGTEYGSFKEMMGDLLGATSPNTPVGTNFNFSKEILGSFARGDFDDLMDGFADRLQQKYDLEESAAQYLKTQQTAGRTLKDAKQDEAYTSMLAEAKKIGQDLQDNRNTIKQPGTQSEENPLGKNFGINSYNAMLALADQFRVRRLGSAPKAKNFAGNLVGTSKEATIDVWAARNLRRHSGRKAIPSSAEQGVTGTVNDVDNFRSTGEFGFGQEILRDVTEDINARFGADSPIGELDPRDVQALQWFIEKDFWTQKGWTSKTGEGGSFEQMLDADPVESVFLGLSREQSAPYQPQDFVPTEEQMIQAGEKILDTVSTDPDVVTFKALPTRGAYMGDPESALDVEIVIAQDMYSPEMLTAATRQAVEDNQHTWFVARRIDDQLARSQPGAFQVGTEVYFDAAKSADDELIDDLQAYLINNGIPAYTLIKDPRDANKVLGMRVLDIPQFYEPDKFAKMSTKQYTNHVTQEFDRLTDLGRELTEEFGQVKSAEPGYFDVNVKTLDQSKDYLRELAERPEESDRIAKAFFGFKEAPRRFQEFAGSSAPYYLRRRKANQADRSKNRPTLSGIGALSAGVVGLGAMQEAQAATRRAQGAPFEVAADLGSAIVAPIAGGIAGLDAYRRGQLRRLLGEDISSEELAELIRTAREERAAALDFEPFTPEGKELSERAQAGVASLLEPVVEKVAPFGQRYIEEMTRPDNVSPLGLLYQGGKYVYEDIFGDAEREAAKSLMDVAL